MEERDVPSRGIVPVPQESTPAASAPLAHIDQLEYELDAADDPASLQELDAKIAAIRQLAQRMNVARAEQNRLAAFCLRTGRKLGHWIDLHVKWGGKGSRSHDVTSIRGGSSAPLPEGITKMQAARLKQLAAIPEETIEEYVAAATERGKLVTAAGLKRYVAQRATPRPDPNRSNGELKPAPVHGPQADLVCECPWPDFLPDLLQRTLGPLDVLVGELPGVPAARELPDDSESLRIPLSGTICVATKRPNLWHVRLAELTRHREDTQSVLAFMTHVVTDLLWLKAGQHALCCQQHGTGSPVLVAAHFGLRSHGFLLGAMPYGVVLTNAQPA